MSTRAGSSIPASIAGAMDCGMIHGVPRALRWLSE
jgi:hypothetical protein